MKPRSPTIEGFRVMFSSPSFGLAEIAWRWSFGFAASVLLAFSLFEYFDTLPVSAGDLFLLRTRHPVLISRAIADIFQGSGFRASKTAILLLILLSVAWIVLASWGRAMTVKALLHYFREEQAPARKIALAGNANSQPRSPLGLNLLRVVVTAAAVLGFMGAFFLGGAMSPSTNPALGSAMLIFSAAVVGIVMAWSLLNWTLSLAAIFAIAHGSRTFVAISEAVELCRIRTGAVFAAGTCFGIAHLVVFSIATSVVAFPLAFVGILPAGVILGGVLLVAMLYFAAVDFLYAGRMAAYVAMILPPELFMPDPLPLSGGPERSLRSRYVRSSIDRDEVILSDVQILPAGD